MVGFHLVGSWELGTFRVNLPAVSFRDLKNRHSLTGNRREPVPVNFIDWTDAS